VAHALLVILLHMFKRRTDHHERGADSFGRVNPIASLARWSGACNGSATRSFFNRPELFS
jgi:hypothetical protein